MTPEQQRRMNEVDRIRELSKRCVWDVPTDEEDRALDKLATKWGSPGGRKAFDGLGLGGWSLIMSKLYQGVTGDPDSERERDEIGKDAWEEFKHGVHDMIELRHETLEIIDERTNPFRGPGGWVEGTPEDPFETY